MRLKRNIPIGWQECAIEELAFVDNSTLSSKTSDSYKFGYISLADIEKGIINIELREFTFKDAPSRARRVVQKDDVLVSTVRPNLMGHARITNKVKDTVASTGFSVVTPVQKEYSEYIYQYIFSHGIRRQFHALVAGSNYPAITSNDVKTLKLVCPKNKLVASEIGRILGLWDKCINQLEVLTKKKQFLIKALMQQLLSGKRRFPEFNSEWKEFKLNEVAKPIQRPVEKPKIRYRALGIRSHFKGTFEKYIDDPTTVAMDELYVAKEGDLIVNITFAWEGAIAIVPEEHDGGLVSHRFPMFRPIEEKLDIDYLRYVVIQPRFKYLLGVISPGGAGRNRVLSKKDFMDLLIFLPEIDEQRKIGRTLRILDKEIGLLHKQLDTFKQQKKGLMQQLLTGKKRVKVTEAA